MTNEKYIPIEEVPSSRATWPYQEWADTIPEGMALEITDQIPEGRSAAGVASVLQPYFRLRDLPLIAMRRGDRLFVARKRVGGTP